jgi:hypothetical protein
MKFFIAAPWRSKELVKGLVEELTQKGYGTYSFLESGANLASGASIGEELRSFSAAMQNWQDDQNIKKIFESEMEGLKSCDAVIMLEPVGHSSLLEAGIGHGMGKKVFIVGDIEKPEVFYLIAQKFYRDIQAFLEDVAQIAGS